MSTTQTKAQERYAREKARHMIAIARTKAKAYKTEAHAVRRGGKN